MGYLKYLRKEPKCQCLDYLPKELEHRVFIDVNKMNKGEILLLILCPV